MTPSPRSQSWSVVASDLDGTLLDSGRGVTKRTASAVERVRRNDGRFLMVTGRPVRWITQIVEQLGTTDPVIALNGADPGFIGAVDGYHELVAGDGTNYTISGVDPKDLVQPIAHQHRLWFVEKDSTNAWYLPPEQVFGVAKFFDFGGNFNRGGFLQALVTYTVDSGYGPNDYLAAVSSAGEVSLYQGIDPNDPAEWKLIGVFYAGATFTRRCWTKFGGDFALLTQYGMVTMNSILKPADDSVLNNALSLKIQYLISEVVTEGLYRPGWEVLTYPAANMMIINVPGIIPEQTFGDGFWTKCRVLEKSLYVGNESVEAARAFRREVFDGVGGWNENLTAAGFGVGAVMGEDPVGLAVDELLDRQRQLSDQLPGDIGDAVDGGNEVEVIVRWVGGRVVAAVLIQALSDAAHFLGPALETSDLGEVDQAGEQFGHVPPVATVGGSVEDADVLPADQAGFERIGQGLVAGMEFLGDPNSIRGRLPGLFGAVCEPHVGGVPVHCVADARLGDLGQQHAFAVIQPRPLSCDRHQLVQFRSTLGCRQVGSRRTPGQSHFQVVVAARLAEV